VDDGVCPPALSIPASGFRAVFFAKRASLRVCPFEPSQGSQGPQKSFKPRIYPLTVTILLAVKFIPFFKP